MRIDFKLFRISLASLILIVLIVALICAFLRQDLKATSLEIELRHTQFELRNTQVTAEDVRFVERSLVDVRQDAVTKFAQYEQRIQAKWDAWINQLVEALKHKEPAVRQWAAQRLSEFGVNALDAVPALRELEHDSDPNARAVAADAIKKIEGDETEHDGP